jgi:DNA-binding SARP family transcriptional activator
VVPDGAVVAAGVAGRPAASARTRIRLALLGTFEARVDDASISLPMNAQRLLAFLALCGRSVLRSFVAGSLWLDSTDDRAAGSLRSSLWRVNREARFVEATGEQLRLAATVAVDVDAAVDQAHRLLDPASVDCPSPRDFLLHDDLLPDWYDDWVALERERFRQLRLHALEQLCERLLAAGRYGEASEVALAAAQAEPLRESAHRLIVRIHLREGNQSEALGHYKRFQALLLEQLGLEPSPTMNELVADLTPR